MTDKFLSEEELRLLVNNDKLFEYYDLKNIYLGTSGDNIKRCYDCQIILDRSEKYRCKEHAKIYSREQSRQYKNKYLRRPYVKFTPEDKELLLKFK